MFAPILNNLIVTATFLVYAAMRGVGGASAIGAVPAEVALVEPPALVAVTTAWMVEPSSVPVRV
jgi:EamA domain-containing membrane protein RarD